MPKMIRFIQALSWINEPDIIADVGCDHGYLGIMAIEKGVNFVQFIDNKEGPLLTAKSNLVSKNIDSSKYQLSLSDGLTNLNPLVKKIVIMGMGGDLITHILDHNLLKISSKYFIFEANSKVKFLREFLYQNNFIIIDEEMVFEDKYYEMIYCKAPEKITKNNQIPDEKMLLFGEILLKKRSKNFIDKWTKRLNYINSLLKSGPISDQLLKEKKEIEEILCQK